MDLIELLVIISSIFDTLSIVHQWKSIRIKKTIYGISFDFLGFQCLDFCCRVIYLTCYLSTKINILYGKRNPIYPEICFSYCIYITDIIKAIFSLSLIFYVFKFHSTKRHEQYFSIYFISIVIINTFILLVISNYVANHKFTLNFLDLVDYIWFIHQQSTLLKFWPQVLMNWVLWQNYLTIKFIRYQLVSIIILCFFTILCHYKIWYTIPVNYSNITYLINLPLIIVLKYQASQPSSLKKRINDDI